MNRSSNTAGENAEAECSVPDWDSWIEENTAELLLFARARTRNEADARDVLQKALVQLVHCVESGRFKGGVMKSWVKQAICNLSKDLGRREDSLLSRQGRALADAETEAEPPWFSSPDDQKYLAGRVQELLKSLPAGFAEVVVLKIWDENTFQEIGEILRINPNTAASRYRYALKYMWDALQRSPIE